MGLHLAIIMDGNRRWAEAHGLTPAEGHKRGVAALKSIVEVSPKLDIEYLTVYAFSTENWSRSPEEVEFLMSLFVQTIAAEVSTLKAKGVRLRFIGNKSKLNPTLQNSIQEAEQHTEENGLLNLQIAVNYGGRSEIEQASLQGSIGENLYTAGIPDPDLLIRTGGEQRLSNFLLWQLAYSELFFIETLWPDFGPDQLEQCLTDFKRRSRRFGK